MRLLTRVILLEDVLAAQSQLAATLSLVMRRVFQDRMMVPVRLLKAGLERAGSRRTSLKPTHHVSFSIERSSVALFTGIIS